VAPASKRFSRARHYRCPAKAHQQPRQGAVAPGIDIGPVVRHFAKLLTSGRPTRSVTALARVDMAGLPADELGGQIGIPAARQASRWKG
ncbi:MAG: hypothetical protein ACREFD_05135, partial [Stellaceae bacterium]